MVGSAAVTPSVAQVMTEGAPEEIMPEEEGILLWLTITKTRVQTGTTNTVEGQTFGDKGMKEAVQ
jgi:hypothetical protein